MRLCEFIDAVEGFNELEAERLRWQFYCTRKMCFYIAATQGVKDLSEEEIIPIKEIDEAIKKNRVETLPLAKIIVDGPE